MDVNYVSGAEVLLSILVALVTTLVGVIVALVLRSQSKFERRIEDHIHSLRDDMQTCTAQLLILKTVTLMQLPDDKRQLFEAALKQGGS